MDTPWTEIIKGTNNYTWFRAREIVTGWNTAGQSIEHMTTLAIAINRRHKTHDARFRVVGLIRAPA
jgi:hypothetical protein